MKTRVIPMLVTLVALLSCEESVQVDGPKIPDTDKTVTVILADIPAAAVPGGTIYLFTLNDKGEVYAIQEAEAVEGAAVQVAPVPGLASFDIVALIPTGSDWSSENPFTEGYYSRATAIQDKAGAFVTNSWTTAPTLSDAPTTGLTATLQVEMYVNGLASPPNPDFTRGEIVTLEAAVTDHIKSGVTSVAFLLDGNELESYSAMPYRLQFNTVDVAKGDHWLSVKASNAAGHVSLDSIKIFVSETAGESGPSIYFSALYNGIQIERQQVVVVDASASDPDDGVERVEFRINNTLVGSDLTAPYSFVWDTYDNEVGNVIVEITALDKSGQSRSDVINVSLIEPANYAPRAAITGPTDGTSFAAGTASIPLTATATDPEGDAINRVEFYYRNILGSTNSYLGQDTTTPYAFDFNTSALPAGQYYIFARAYDNSGNYSYDSVTITIE